MHMTHETISTTQSNKKERKESVGIHRENQKYRIKVIVLEEKWDHMKYNNLS